MKITYTNTEIQADDTLIINTSNNIYIDNVMVDTSNDDLSIETYIKKEDDRGVLYSFLALNTIDESSEEKLNYYIELLKDNVDKIVLIYGGNLIIEDDQIVNNDILASIVNNLEIDLLLTLDNETSYLDVCINDTNIIQIAKNQVAAISMTRAIINTEIN